MVEEAEVPSPRPDRAEPARLPAVVGATPRAGGQWQLPKITLLSATKQLSQDLRQLEVAGQTLVAALEAHGVTTTLLGKTVGPTVTRFELELGAGVKVARVTSLSRDIAYAMASPDVRILAPIPGKSAIGVEVPNRNRQLVALRDILDSPEAKAATHPLEVAMGRDIAGRAVMANLAEMPHILISGATGAGKSSCINSIITSVLMRSTPEQVRLMLIDPKRVELGQYNGLQHLISPVVVDPKKAANALQWAVKEMERRYDLLAENGMRDITGYNLALAAGELTPGRPSVGQEAHGRGDGQCAGRRPPCRRTAEEEIDDEPPPPEVLPFILIVVDELNDLMMVAARDVEDSVVRIAQMARAVGIHLVLATQRPSVDVITGVIKANIPSRMALSVSSLADSRVILDQAGAERLVGKGDMLLLTASSNVPRRLQAPWVSEKEVKDVVEHWHAQGGTTEPVVGIENVLEGLPGGIEGVDDDDDDLLSGGHGPGRPIPVRVHLHVAEEAPGGLRPRRAVDGPPRAPGSGRPERGLQGASGVDDHRRARWSERPLSSAEPPPLMVAPFHLDSLEQAARPSAQAAIAAPGAPVPATAAVTPAAIAVDAGRRRRLLVVLALVVILVLAAVAVVRLEAPTPVAAVTDHHAPTVHVAVIARGVAVAHHGAVGRRGAVRRHRRDVGTGDPGPHRQPDQDDDGLHHPPRPSRPGRTRTAPTSPWPSPTWTTSTTTPSRTRPTHR